MKQPGLFRPFTRKCVQCYDSIQYQKKLYHSDSKSQDWLHTWQVQPEKPNRLSSLSQQNQCVIIDSKHRKVVPSQQLKRKPEFKAHKQPKILVVEDNSHYI